MKNSRKLPKNTTFYKAHITLLYIVTYRKFFNIQWWGGVVVCVVWVVCGMGDWCMGDCGVGDIGGRIVVFAFFFLIRSSL